MCEGARHLEIIHVIPSLLSGQALSAAKDLFGRLARSFAALRMTCRTPLEAAHGNLLSKCLIHRRNLVMERASVPLVGNTA